MRSVIMGPLVFHTISFTPASCAASIAFCIKRGASMGLGMNAGIRSDTASMPPLAARKLAGSWRSPSTMWAPASRMAAALSGRRVKT